MSTPKDVNYKDVILIRGMSDSGIPGREIARRLGFKYENVRSIITRWSHI